MASRELRTLVASMEIRARMLLKLCEENNLDLLIYCTYRSMEEQARLFRQGRSLSEIKRRASELTELGRSDLASVLMGVGAQSGQRVTNAAPGQSLHNYGFAFDAVPLNNGDPAWNYQGNEELWKLYGSLGNAVGLEWGGNWESFKDYPHMQERQISWRELIKK